MICTADCQYQTPDTGSSPLKTNTDEAETNFFNGAKKLGLLGVKGHRSVGGMRVSNYNSIPLDGAVKLVDFIHGFAGSK